MWFKERLAALDDYVDAVKLAHSGPGPDQPGRKNHSNLAFFLQQFTVPHGSNSTERSLYLAFVRKLDKAGKLKPGGLATVESRFVSARPPYEY
jgi:hypothetical protein